jgi:hypothetical protein
MAFILQTDNASIGKGHAMAAAPGRQNTIKQIDTLPDRLQQVLGTTDSHEIAGAVFGKVWNGYPKRTDHLLVCLSDTEPTNGITRKI